MTPAAVGAGIRPLSRSRSKIFADLGTRNGRERQGLFRLEGPRAIEDALRHGARFRHVVVSEVGEPLLMQWAERGWLPPEVELHRATDSELAAIADTATPQGVVAIGALPALTADDLPADLGDLVLLADGLQDPGNLGTLLRTLAAVGGRAAILVRGTVDPYNPKALRASAGTAFALSIAAGLDHDEAAGLLAERGVRLVALAVGAPSLFDADLPAGPLALAVGNEAAGLTPELSARAELALGLPMAPGIDSLSAPVAGSIALYALAHRLRGR